MRNSKKKKGKKGSNSKKNKSKKHNEIKSTESGVILNIPEFEYEKVKIKAKKLDAHVSVDARLGNMVKVHAGAEAYMNAADIELNNVKAEAHLVLRLKRIREILYKTSRTVVKNYDTLKPLMVPIADVTDESSDELSEKVLKTFGGTNSTAKKELDKAIRRDIRKTVKKDGEVKKEIPNKG